MTVYFYNTKHLNRGSQIPLQLVSVGIIADDGREFYGINENALTNVLRDPWFSVNIQPTLPVKQQATMAGPSGFVTVTEWDNNHPEYADVYDREILAERVLDFFLAGTTPARLWGHYTDYQHVVLTQLWGDLGSQPSVIPLRTNDLQQVLDTYPEIQLPPPPPVAHHALWDARWAHDVYQVLAGNQPKYMVPQGEVI